MNRIKYTITFETDERLSENEECELMAYISQFGGEIKIEDDAAHSRDFSHE